MKILKISTICVLLCAILLGGSAFLIESVITRADANQGSNGIYNDNGFASGDDPLANEESSGESPVFPSETNSFVSNYYIEDTNQDAPFFTTILPSIANHIEENNTHSVTPYYDKLPLANNPENFQGLGKATYANINGKTVTAEAFYRVQTDSLHDPNCGMGLLIYQCIMYKLNHPDEEVEITFSTYRTSVTASVCVIPESKYYGYMRSLYGTNYDEHGFVRISYMLVEAARMGIKVTMINQEPSYATQQYNPETDALASRNHIDFEKYFNMALTTDCYNSFKNTSGKKVSDFFDFVVVDWTLEDQQVNMHHFKSATVSHYLATDGTEHTAGIYFTTANLDENNYKGWNGNTYSQSGVIISDHDVLYRVVYNYTQLLNKYKSQEGIYELRGIILNRNIEQMELIKSGNADKIPEDELILYLGSESDKVFELYFTPLGGATDTWDVEYNPVCKYTTKLTTSEDYIEFAWNEYACGKSYLKYSMSKMLEIAFCQNKNPKNKLYLCVPEFDKTVFKSLKKGTDIGYIKLKDATRADAVHAKDMMFSYVENGERQYVTLLTSANFYLMEFYYRTNSFLVIHETEETGNTFYKVFGNKFSGGMIQ